MGLDEMCSAAGNMALGSLDSSKSASTSHIAASKKLFEHRISYSPIGGQDVFWPSGLVSMVTREARRAMIDVRGSGSENVSSD